MDTFFYVNRTKCLLQAIQQGDCGETQMQLQMLALEINDDFPYSTEYLQHVFFYVLDRLQGYAAERQLQVDGLTCEDRSPLYSKTGGNNLSERFQFLTRVVTDVLDRQIVLGQVSDSAHVYIRRAQTYIHEHYKSDLSLNQIAEAFAVNPAYLSKLFSEKLGISISRYVARYRLEQAKLLLQSQLPVAQVGQESGFPSTQSFIRCFKQLEGMTPGEYSRQQKNKGL